MCGDLDALYKFICSKGQNANVPCPLHSNVVSLKSGWARGGSVLRAFNCLGMSEMVPHTDANIREVARALARAAAERDAGRMTGPALDALSTELGWSHSSDNILMDEAIKFDVASALHVDWFHTYLRTGIFKYEVAFLFTLFRHGAGAVKNVTFDVAREFSSKFTWPRRLASLAHLLNKDRVSKESLHFKCSGSEGLCLYRYWQCFCKWSHYRWRVASPRSHRSWHCATCRTCRCTVKKAS